MIADQPGQSGECEAGLSLESYHMETLPSPPAPDMVEESTGEMVEESEVVEGDNTEETVEEADISHMQILHVTAGKWMQGYLLLLKGLGPCFTNIVSCK